MQLLHIGRRGNTGAYRQSNNTCVLVIYTCFQALLKTVFYNILRVVEKKNNKAHF